MSKVNEDRIKQIESEMAEQRAQIETSERAIESMRNDPDMMADSGAREGGRINIARKRINELEAELRSLQGSPSFPTVPRPPQK